jgi:hypothetical protein
MPLVRVGAIVDLDDPREALRLVTDYRRWPQASESVRSVVVDDQGDGTNVSTWEVVFRGGLMRWTERDRLYLDEGRQTFALIEGDPHGFAGTWTVEQRGEACALVMDADFDLGMPSLSHVLDPMAIETLEDAVADVIRGLFGADTPLSFGDDVLVNREPQTTSREGA